MGKISGRSRRLVAVFAASALLACGGDDGDSGPRLTLTSGSGGATAGMASTAGDAAGGTGGSAGSASGAGRSGGAGVTGSAGMSAALAGSGAGRGGSNGAAGGAAGGIAPGDCPAPPAGASAPAIAALNAVNGFRIPAGAGCATMIAEINTAAQNHCDYYTANTGTSCTADPHSEVASCSGFTGTNPGARMMAAGYMGRGSSEVMAFLNNPERAVATWVNSVWHRLPILDPWTTHLGYGGSERCDTIDFGRGTPAPNDTVVFYPYAGQTALPTTFDGSREGPEPPEPPTGWPSASPITVYAQMLTVTEHVLTKDGDATPIEHVWLTSADSNFLRNAIMMYANQPFAANTTYRVKITGSYVGGPLALEWTFTTGATNRF